VLPKLAKKPEACPCPLGHLPSGLPAGNVCDTVEVQAAPNEVVVESRKSGGTVTEREVSDPLVSGRNPLLAVQFKAGVVWLANHHPAWPTA